MPKSTHKKSILRDKATSKKLAKGTSLQVARSVRLPKVFDQTKLTYMTLLTQKTLVMRFISLVLVALLAVTGMAYLAYYDGLSQSTDDASGNLSDGLIKKSVEVTALYISLASGGANGLLNESQKVYIGIVYLLFWLIIFWLLRHIVNKTVVSLRDGLYNAAAPFLSTLMLFIVACLQIVPLALVVTLFASLTLNGLFTGAFWLIIYVIIIALAAAGTLYWLLGTLISLIVVTIPGTYPIAALKSARTIVTGYRKQLLVHVAWLLLLLVLVQAVVMVTVIGFDAAIGYRVPLIIALVYQLTIVISGVFGAAYLYILYRSLIDERSQ